MKKEGKYISIKTLVMSTVLIMAVGTALFLTVEAESQDWDVNNDGCCNLLDVNQVAYYVGSNNPDYDVNNDGSVDQYDIQLVESHCDWQSGSPTNTGSFVDTLVYVDPAYTAVAAGKTFSVDIYCVPGEVIRGFQFDLNFDETKLQAISVTNVGDIWSGYTVYSNPGTIDNANGKITYVYATIQDNVETDVAGIFATITFTASTTSIGSSSLDLDNVKVTNLNDYVTTVVTGGTSEVFKNVQNTDTSEWFLTIQAAIDDSDTVNGHHIAVTDGTYTITSPINVNKGVTITGNIAHPENVVVKYGSAVTDKNCFDITVSNVIVQGIKAINGKMGFYLNGVTGCKVSNCIVSSCADKGIYVRNCPATSEATRVEVTGNIVSDCGNTWGSACIQTYVSPYTYIYDNTIDATEDKGINIIKSGATGTADRIQVIGNTISETKWPGIQAIGSPYTYICDNTLTECNYYGADSTGDWDYASIHIADDGAVSGANVIIDSNTVSDGINGIQTWSDYVTITNNNIYNMGLTYADTKGTAGVDDGVYYNSGIIIGSNWLTSNFKPTGTTITGNDIHNNYWGLYVRDYVTLSPGDSSVLSVTAECNWWGHCSGPTHSGNPLGCGDAASDYVDYLPWLDASGGSCIGGLCADPVYVDDDFTSATPGWNIDHFATIQDGIDRVCAPGTVNVADGTYTITGKILVHKSVTVTGNIAHPENVVVQYSSLTNSLMFDMRASTAVIEGIKTTNGRSGFWFDQSGVTGCTISKCIIDNVGEYAIYMKNGGSGHTIDSCTISNTGQTCAGAPAILIENSLDVTINGNTLNSISDKGIYVRVCSATSAAERVEVTGNIISGCAYSCIQVYQSPYTIVGGNTISSTSDKGINIIGLNANSAAERVELTNNIISGCPWGGILVTHDRYTYIHGNTVGPTGDKGISIANGENIGNAGERIEVSGNTVTGTKYPGIQVAYEVPYTYIYDNTLTGCNYYGGDGTGDWDYASIHVAENCDNTIVDSNDVSDGINGIQIWSNNCEVTNNDIYNMGLTYADTKGTAGVDDGVYYNSGIIIGSNWLTSNFKPTGTTITGNDIHNNYWGLYVRDYVTLSPGDPSVLSVTAECNWWGTAYGPLATDNVDYVPATGKIGDSVSDNVDYTGWYWNDKTTCNGIPEYDINMDGIINIIDIDAVAGKFGDPCSPPGGEREDVSDDGIIDILDLQMVAYYYGDFGWE